MSEELYKEWISPFGNVTAIVESDGSVVFLYLHGPKDSDFKMKSCWVRNLDVAPTELNVAAMREGLAPLLPAEFCAHPLGLSAPDEDDLEVVWFEEGDGAALIENDEILAIIPGWSGHEGFHGYARDCVKESPLCWPLGNPSDNLLFERVAKAQKYWALWDDNYWQIYRDEKYKPLKDAFGAEEKYFAIDGGEFPPRALLQFRKDDYVVLVTLGMSILAQPDVERDMQNPSGARRIELGWSMTASYFDKHRDIVLSYVAAQSRYPWDFFTWLGEGHTLPCSATSETTGELFTYALLETNALGAPDIQLPKTNGDPVRILWMLPITESERSVAQGSGSGALIERLKSQGRSWIFNTQKQS